MARAYSMDLRERALAAAQAQEGSRAEVARRFGIGEATLYSWLRRWREESSLKPRPHGGGRRARLDEAGMSRLKEHVEQHNDCTLDEYCTWAEQALGIAMSTSAMDRALARLRLVRKKRRFAPASRSART